jgi:hypothetical protein
MAQGGADCWHQGRALFAGEGYTLGRLENTEKTSVFGCDEPLPNYEPALESRQYVVKFDVKNDVKSAPLAPMQSWGLQLSVTYQ